MKRVLSSSAESTDGKGFRPQPQQNLLHLDVSRSDDLAPCFDLELDMLVELLRGAGDRIKANLSSRSCISGILIELTISRLSSSTMLFGVPVGTRIPTQLSPQISGYPASVIVSTSGTPCDRTLPVT